MLRCVAAIEMGCWIGRSPRRGLQPRTHPEPPLFSPCEKQETAEGVSLDKEKTLVEIAATTGRMP